MLRTLAQVAALLVLAVIIYATLSPLDLRPRTGFVAFEREAAFALLGLALMLAFPDHAGFVVLGVIVVAIGLELAQHLTPDRHSRLIDALQKAGGALAGCAIGYIANRFLV